MLCKKCLEHVLVPMIKKLVDNGQVYIEVGQICQSNFCKSALVYGFFMLGIYFGQDVQKYQFVVVTYIIEFYVRKI